jgi:uncharacterized protein (DUF305 family)
MRTTALLVGIALVSGVLSQVAIAEMTPADHGFMEAMQVMDQGMKSAQPTGDADKDFVTMMLPHHQGAVDMSKVELQYGKDPELRSLAENIIKAQNYEIAQMKAWLAKHGQ